MALSEGSKILASERRCPLHHSFKIIPKTVQVAEREPEPDWVVWMDGIRAYIITMGVGAFIGFVIHEWNR